MCCSGCSSFESSSAFVVSAGSGSADVGVGKLSCGAVTTILVELAFCASASFVLRILSVMAFKLGIFLYPRMSFSSLSTIRGGIPSGGVDVLPEGSVVTAETLERSDAVGDTGLVVGALTAVESAELAVAFVNVDA